MALVEGFDNEVIQFFGILFVVVLIVLLWISTQVHEMQIVRGAVFILERRTRRQHHDATRAAPLVPNQSISEQSATETVPLNDVIQTNSTLSNDNLEIQGRLQETIGVFKRRHFTNELTSNKIIRLIFQGKVLHDDEASLSSCGLHDNCVVHCPIHQPRPTANAQQSPDPVNQDTAEQPLPNTIRHGHGQPGGPVQHELILAVLLSALIIIISLLWYAKIEFYTLFSSVSADTLAILTAIILFTTVFTYLAVSEEQQHHLPQLRHN
ncbi:transmembrane and ubiquitin-like domain-containing protein 1 [Acyrthosiphon pisum]|uniref:Ubiquitin-like domain-containing protein n=1 Tax=Acyrthosiphon pisum TaxID=7029 RepID=A0A8R2HAM7_ACYPI|nr:transmembrane and ubiquitin-like domain-containing protein 1 [Acyrthosiphon pisum]|eukprot:XP_016664132.1 PREDICTED: transmembrane and ubiquitin-like domain-containing protein 1 [Acyrthosiphon pisum]